MSLAPGRELTHYRLVEPIGEGGMGVVWRAIDTTLGREVAIKVLPEAFARDPERMARFEREARVLASLNHPRIAAVYGVGVADGVRFLAMELVTGDDLAARIARGPLSVVEALEAAQQITEGLEAAHEKGVIHRDLKPANVKVTPDGQAKILDFGLAKAIEGDASATGSSMLSQSPTITGPMTGASVILGTAAYMSPEQARGKAVDRRADIWAFGCVLYEMLTGRRVFAGETVSDTLAKILAHEPDLAALPGGTPPRIRELLRRCLVKDARLRLRDIGDARIVLDEVLAARSPTGRLLVRETAEAGAASRRAPLVGLAIAAVALLALGAWLWNTLGPRGAGGSGREPTCLTVSMPPGVGVQQARIARDGRTVAVLGRPAGEEGSDVAPPRIYVRRLDGYEFKALPGTEGAEGLAFSRDGRMVGFNAPVLPGAPQVRISAVPVDGSAPATAIADWRDSWTDLTELESGDFLAIDGGSSIERLSRVGGAVSAPVKLDAGRPGVLRYGFAGGALPADRGVFLNVVSYDAHGWHVSVGVLNPRDGRVKVVEEDGGNAVYSPTGHMVFARGDVILAVPFDPARAEVHGAPVAVWSGLSTGSPFVPGVFSLTDDGALFYRPGQAGGTRVLAILDSRGKFEPWSPEHRAVEFELVPSPDGRRIACAIINARGIDEIWVTPIDHSEFRRLGTDPNADCFWPTWSPDGGRIAYARRGKDGRDGVYVQAADGGEAHLVLKPESDQMIYRPGAWAPDGSGLLLTRQDGARSNVVLLPFHGGEADSGRRTAIFPAEFNHYRPLLSRDGRRLAYVSDENGTGHTRVAEVHPGSLGRSIEVRTSGSIAHAWGPDGKTLYVEDDRRRLMKVSIAAAPFSVSAPTEVADLQKLRVAMWAVLPDGRFLVGMNNENEDEITRLDLVLNWTEVLKKKLRAAP